MVTGKKPSIIVLGVGNILLQDEGTGVEVANALKAKDLPDNVDVIDGATAGLDLMTYFENYDFVIVVDVVRAGDEVGAIYRFSPDDVKGSFQAQSASLHDIGIIDVWNTVKILKGDAAQTVIIAIEPESIDWGTGLTPKIKKRIPELVDLVLEEIENINQNG